LIYQNRINTWFLKNQKKYIEKDIIGDLYKKPEYKINKKKKMKRAIKNDTYTKNINS